MIQGPLSELTALPNAQQIKTIVETAATPEEIDSVKSYMSGYNILLQQTAGVQDTGYANDKVPSMLSIFYYDLNTSNTLSPQRKTQEVPALTDEEKLAKTHFLQAIKPLVSDGFTLGDFRKNFSKLIVSCEETKNEYDQTLAAKEGNAFVLN